MAIKVQRSKVYVVDGKEFPTRDEARAYEQASVLTSMVGLTEDSIRALVLPQTPADVEKARAAARLGRYATLGLQKVGVLPKPAPRKKKEKTGEIEESAGGLFQSAA
jgi:hypothetical protein